MARQLSVEAAPSIRARDLLPSTVISVSARDTVGRVAGLMQTQTISQFPVLDSGTGSFVGVVSEATLARLLAFEGDPQRVGRLRVAEVMEGPPPGVDERTPLEEVADLLSKRPLVLTLREGRVSGILTKADLLRSLSPAWSAGEPRRRRGLLGRLRGLRSRR